MVARITRELLARCQELNTQINALDAELRVLVRAQAPALLAIPGCGVLSAAVIIGETAGVHRFGSRARFARFTGTAPVPVWSGASAGKVRLNRGGNRDMNCALHTIAITQARQAVHLDPLQRTDLHSGDHPVGRRGRLELRLNALAETINGLYKTEVIRHQGPWRGVDQVEHATAEWVDWINTTRLFEYCGDIPPVELEHAHYHQNQPPTEAA